MHPFPNNSARIIVFFLLSSYVYFVFVSYCNSFRCTFTSSLLSYCTSLLQLSTASCFSTFKFLVTIQLSTFRLFQLSTLSSLFSFRLSTFLQNASLMANNFKRFKCFLFLSVTFSTFSFT